MSALPVAQYLKDLSGEVGRVRGRPSSELASEASKGADAVARMAEAYGRGLAEGKAAAKAEFDEKLAQQSKVAEERLAVERERWAAEEGGRLADLIASHLGALEARIGDQVAKVLKPVFIVEVQRRAVAELASTLESLMSNGEFGEAHRLGSGRPAQDAECPAQREDRQCRLHAGPGVRSSPHG